MDFLVKRSTAADEQVVGTSILVRPGGPHFAYLHILDRGLVVFTAPTGWIEIQDCGNCLAVTLGQAKYQRATKPAWHQELLPPGCVRQCRVDDVGSGDSRSPDPSGHVPSRLGPLVRSGPDFRLGMANFSITRDLL